MNQFNGIPIRRTGCTISVSYSTNDKITSLNPMLISFSYINNNANCKHIFFRFVFILVILLVRSRKVILVHMPNKYEQTDRERDIF